MLVAAHLLVIPPALSPCLRLHPCLLAAPPKLFPWDCCTVTHSALMLLPSAGLGLVDTLARGAPRSIALPYVHARGRAAFKLELACCSAVMPVVVTSAKLAAMGPITWTAMN